MRASPAFRIRVARYGVWRAAVAALVVVAFAVQAAWLASRAADTPVAASVMLAIVGLALLGGAAGATRTAPVELYWDTRRWLLHPNGTGAGPHPGNLTIALDLGDWMLLRFDPDPAPPARRRATWLAVQRIGVEAHWHALRCAVYCARPAPGTDALANSHGGAESQE
jgi:hypothetical protein